MKNNFFIWLSGILVLFVFIESGYFYKSMDKHKEQTEAIRFEIENKIDQRKILIEDIIKVSDLKRNLYYNERFINKINVINCSNHDCTLFLFLPGNVCLDCMKNQINIILRYIKKKENLSLVILCRPIDYRKNLHFKSSDFNIEIIAIEETISVNSDRPFIFKMGVNKIDDLFFINKNFEDFTKSSMISISSDC